MVNMIEILDTYLGKFYYTNNLLHREDGPAIEYVDGGVEYYVNNKRHRIDGPAVDIIGYQEYCINGKKHREDGPASIDSSNLSKIKYEWWYNGKRICARDNNHFLKLIKKINIKNKL